MKPSGVITNPEPLPATSVRFLTRCSISLFTTAGATRATALTTEREYSSSNKSSVETSFLLVKPEPFCGCELSNRVIAVGAPCSDTAKSFVISSRKRSTDLNLPSTTADFIPYNPIGLLLSSCALFGSRLKKGHAKVFFGRVSHGRAVSFAARARSDRRQVDSAHHPGVGSRHQALRCASARDRRYFAKNAHPNSTQPRARRSGAADSLPGCSAER